MICAIHQPNFFPWYPFFQKIKYADVFVILENCQFEKNNFQNRFSYNNKWYTMRVNRGNIPIIEKTYLDAYSDWKMIKRKLPKYLNILNQFDDCIEDNLSKTNINIIKKTCKILNITTKIIVDYPTNLMSSERLVDLCLSVDATKYFAGVGK